MGYKLANEVVLKIHYKKICTLQETFHSDGIHRWRSGGYGGRIWRDTQLGVSLLTKYDSQ